MLRRLSLLWLVSLSACVDQLLDAPQEFATATYALTAAEYPPANWQASPNFTAMSRKPGDVSIIVIHTTQGTYQSAVNWFLNPAAQVSAHYVISKKGEITEMVLEKDKAWHVGSENKSTIGIEHEGMVDDPKWATEPMLDASAQLSCYLLKKWQLPATRDHIKGHVELPNQTHTDPGKYWPWDLYMSKVAACMTTTPVPCSNCDDKNGCTKDTCVNSQCVHYATDGIACNDGDPCSVNDTCAVGKCVPGPAKGCMDASSAADTAAPDAGSAVDVPGDASASDDSASVAPDTSATSVSMNTTPQSAKSGCQASARGDASALALCLGLFAWVWRRARRRT